MANLDRIVNVQISLGTTAIQEQSFSDLLVLGPHSASLSRILIVTSADELLELGLGAADPIYMAVRDAFKQVPTLSRIYVGRQQVDDATVTVVRASESLYGLRLSWRDAQGGTISEDYSYQATGADTLSTIAQKLVAKIVNSPVTAVAIGGQIQLTNNTAGQAVTVTTVGNLELVAASSSEPIAESLSACRRENDGWYGIVLSTRDPAQILSAAEWSESAQKLLGACSSDTGVVDPSIDTDLASALQQKQFFRTHLWYHANAATEWLDAAIMANRFTFYPGSETWANARVAGISYDKLAEGAALAAHGKNANTFEAFRNFAITQMGRVAGGEWIDVIRFRDWLTEQMKINVTSAMINANGKVPYTDGGISIIAAAMRKALDLGVSRGGIAPEEVDEEGRVIPSYVMQVPLASNVPANDKANRILRDLRFTARLSGAIHAVEIKGTLTYAL